MSSEAFFHRDGDAFVPNPICAGPWDPKSLHGRVIAGLLGASIESDFGSPDFQFSRLTVDLWRLPGFDPITVKTELKREGGRIRIADAECFAAGASIGRASGVLLRRGEAPGDSPWSPPNWDMPHPDTIPADPRPPEAPPGWTPMWEMRSQGARWGGPGQKRVWMRELRPLIAGEPLTPFQRVALSCDFTSPLTNSGEDGLKYINVDITLYLHRDPVDEWVGFESANHQASEGVAFGACTLYDSAGCIGQATVAALAQRRRA